MYSATTRNLLRLSVVGLIATTGSIERSISLVDKAEMARLGGFRDPNTFSITCKAGESAMMVNHVDTN
jgi:hypothetical protein